MLVLLLAALLATCGAASCSSDVGTTEGTATDGSAGGGQACDQRHVCPDGEACVDGRCRADVKEDTGTGGDTAGRDGGGKGDAATDGDGGPDAAYDGGTDGAHTDGGMGDAGDAGVQDGATQDGGTGDAATDGGASDAASDAGAGDAASDVGAGDGSADDAGADAGISCPNSCQFTHGQATCVNGTCVGLVCAGGFKDKNGTIADGCECTIAPETCNGADDDCDNLVDEVADLVAPLGLCLTAGVCAGTVPSCGGGAWVCPYPAAYADPDATCDGVDNDCDGTPDTGNVCGSFCCATGETCAFDVCLANPPQCLVDGECINDTYCAGGLCVPYGVGPRVDRNPDCRRLVAVQRFSPQAQCRWEGPPPGDPYPAHVNVLGTPMVADFNFDNDAEIIRPSIVFVSYNYTDGGSDACQSDVAGRGYYGVIRVIDGRTCQQQFSIGAWHVVGSAPPAIGDLDGDGRPEIVALAATGAGAGGLYAFRYDPVQAAFALHWHSTEQGGASSTLGTGLCWWSGPSIADLDDDGSPEIVHGGVVHGADGVVRAAGPGLLRYSQGIFPTLVDADLDGKVELVTGARIYQYNAATGAFEPEAYSAAAAAGYEAVADFGDFGDGPGVPEVVVISAGFARIQRLNGTTVFGPIALPGGGTGGPPTIADFDGDGAPELAAAGRGSFTVFDTKCTGSPLPAGCAAAGILWTRTSQDYSSSITGSSVFDFEGDGPAEAVYADECFVRVYDGKTGDVIYSQWRSSCTWNENPVIADVDGDYNSEIVIGSNLNCNVGANCQANATNDGGRYFDTQFTGLHCTAPADCPSGLCDAGYCRCAVDDDCCHGGGCAAIGIACANPPAGTPGAGKTCRALYGNPYSGITVYADVNDRWVNSRPIWNQHAYFVTNINDDGTVPRTSQARLNWQNPQLNSYRQNHQGDLSPLNAPDFTSRGGAGGGVECIGGARALTADVCNRGAENVDVGARTGFFDGDPGAGGTLICEAQTTKVLFPGVCETLSCQWLNAPQNDPHDVYVVPDYTGDNTECEEGNNNAIIKDVTCL